MASDPDEIILPILREIRADMAKMASHMATLGAEMSAMRQHHGAVATLQDHDHGDILEIKVRLDRIEKRLDLTD